MDVDNYFWFKNTCLAIVAAGILSACGSGTDDKSSSSSIKPPDLTMALQREGYVELPDGRGGVTYESINYPAAMGFDKVVSLAAFKETLYPLLRTNCAGCHNTENTSGSGGQAPLHSDVNPALAHEHALTQVNFRDIHDSKLSTRLWIDRHNCFSSSCAGAAQDMDAAISAWKSSIEPMLSEIPRSIAADVKVTDQQVEDWITADQAKTAEADREFIQYTTFHVLHNEGVSAQDLNLARVGLAKALNSVARWAPEVVNPVDVNGKGMVYRFDIRDYWGYTSIDTSGNYSLLYGGSDDDLAYSVSGKLTFSGDRISFNDLQNMKSNLRPAVTKDEKFARLVWQRILYGNVEGSGEAPSLPPNIDGFVGRRSLGAARQEYIKAEDLKYVEATQLTFTLTRPDVYNAIMAIPGYSHWLEDELGVDKSSGMDSFNYMVQYEAIAIDSRLYYRATQNTGKNDYYWKTFDTYATQHKDIDEVYAAQEQNSPFWEGPVPVFIAAGGGGGTLPAKFAIIATRNLGPGGERGGGFYTGTDQDSSFGGQQSFASIIYSLPNGLQGYAVYGGFNQRRTDVFTNVIRDPRLLREVADDMLDNYAGYGFPRGSSGDTQIAGIKDVRLNTGSSCIGCHADGMNRGNNNLRDWLDENPALLPGGDHGVDGWINDPTYVSRVRELYKPSSTMRKVMEEDRRTFLETMGKIQQGMIIGPDKNVYQEPTIWSIEWARKYYSFPVTRST